MPNCGISTSHFIDLLRMAKNFRLWMVALGRLIFCAGVGLIVLLPRLACARDVKKFQHPNIVLIVADDLGYGDLSCYGATKISTPAIDKLSASGILFRDAYVASSICSPSRFSILTGCYSWRTRLKYGVLTPFDKPLIGEDQTTLASLLRRNGYDTACIGKWHLGFDWALKTNAPPNPNRNAFNTWNSKAEDYIDFSKPLRGGPTDHGFDYFFGLPASLNMMPYVYIENNRVVEAPTMKTTETYDDMVRDSFKAPDWDPKTVNQVLTKKAVEVIDNHFSKRDGKPLFLYFPTAAIHRPCLPTFTKGKSGAGLRGDMVMEFDWSVSEVVRALKKNHAFNNTLLIVTSDNGPRPGDPLLSLEKYQTEDFAKNLYLEYFNNFKPEFINPFGNEVWKTGWLTYGHRAAGPLLGFKEDAWEGGLRVPFILHWPDEIKSARTNDDMICMTDLMATFADLVGDTLKSGEGRDSYSFLANLFNSNAPQARKTMVVSSGGGGAFVVRMGDWKYIEACPPRWEQTYYPNGPSFRDEQLYNLRDDISEKTNLFSEMPQMAAKLKGIIVTVEHQVRSEGN
jgi:arylsulfatase A